MLLLYTRCSNEWLNHIADLDISHTTMVSSNSLCKVYPFCFNFLLHLSKWLMVCVGLEGFIGVWFPQKLGTMCTVPRAQVIILLLTVLLVCINMHYFWSFDLVFVEDVPGQIDMWFCTFVKHGHHHSEVSDPCIHSVMCTLCVKVL